MTTPASEDVFTEEEAVEVTEMDDAAWESFEAEVAEDSLEDVLEEIEDDLGGGSEAEAEAQRRRRPPTQKMILRRLIALFKRTVRNLLANPRTARKLRAAIKKGPQATCRLLCPLVCRFFPIFLRPLCNRLCPIVCRRLFPWMRVVAKVKSEEVEGGDY